MPARNSLFVLNALRTAARITTALAALGLITACAPDQPLTAPTKGVASGDGVPFTEGLASPAWQETARNSCRMRATPQSRLRTSTRYSLSPDRPWGATWPPSPSRRTHRGIRC